MTGHFELTPDSKHTSNFDYNVQIKDVDDTSVYLDPYEHWFHEYFSERLHLSLTDISLGCLPISTKESARPVHFASNFFFNKVDLNVFIHTFRKEHTMLIHQMGSSYADFFKDSEKHKYLIEGSANEASTVCGWTLSSLYYPELVRVQEDIDKLLQGLKNCQPLQSSTDLLEMADRIASQISQHEGEEDIEAWAERLADDLSKMTD